MEEAVQEQAIEKLFLQVSPYTLVRGYLGTNEDDLWVIRG